MNISEFIQSHRAGPGEAAVTPAQVLGRGQWAAQEPTLSLAEQAEENAVMLLMRGYQPGAVTALAQQIGDVSAELEDERRKIAAGQARAEDLMRMHAAGRITACELNGMSVAGVGDPARVERLKATLASLQGLLAAAQEAGSPPRQEAAGGVERAARTAHQIFAETTRAMMAEVGAGRPRARRPFASRAAAAEGVSCAECTAAGGTGGEASVFCRKPPPVPMIGRGEAAWRCAAAAGVRMAEPGALGLAFQQATGARLSPRSAPGQPAAAPHWPGT